WIVGFRELTEAAGALLQEVPCTGGIAFIEVHTIEHVKEFGAELQSHALGKFEVLAQTHIPSVEAGIAEASFHHVAKCSQQGRVVDGLAGIGRIWNGERHERCRIQPRPARAGAVRRAGTTIGIRASDQCCSILANSRIGKVLAGNQRDGPSCLRRYQAAELPPSHDVPYKPVGLSECWEL